MLANSGSSMRLTSFAEALAMIDALPPSPVSEIAVAAAVGLVLAADAVAHHAVPPQPVAAIDGFALRADATLDASTHAPVPVAATVVRAGEQMPHGSDAVAPPDHVHHHGGKLEALTPIAPGEGVRAEGFDCTEGMVLRRRGERLRQTDLGALALAGVKTVSVRVPQLAIATDAGTEMRAALPGLPSAVQNGANFDSAERVLFDGVGITPGERVALGIAGDTVLLRLPASFDDALAAWLIFGRRLLAHLSGYETSEAALSVTLTRKVVSTVGIADFIPVAISHEKAEPLAARQLPLSALARANGFLIVPPQSEGYPAGTSVSVQPWP